MFFLQEVVRIEVAIFVVGFALVLTWKFLRGAVRLAQRAKGRNALAGGTSGIVRFQMPAVSLVIALLYLVRLTQSAGSGSLPTVPEFVIALLAGSQAVFLGVMARRLLRSSGISRIEGET